MVNTHSHYDHAYGNCQFERCYCSEAEVARMEKKNNPHIWDYLFDENGNCRFTEFEDVYKRQVNDVQLNG